MTPDVIQVPKSDQRILDYELTDCEWRVIKPMLPNNSRPHSTPPAGVAEPHSGARNSRLLNEQVEAGWSSLHNWDLIH
jgi:hypothetical protein